MCVVSAVGAGWGQTFPDRWPGWVQPAINPFQPMTPGLPGLPAGPASHPIFNPPPAVSREEFDALRTEMRELKELLLAAKKFDEATGQVDCEHEEKVALIKKVAEHVGINMDEVFK